VSFLTFHRRVWDSDRNTPTLLPIPQVMSDGSVQEFDYLPSAIYLLANDEIGKIVPILPWRHHDTECVVGMGALALGPTPNRAISTECKKLVESPTSRSSLSHSSLGKLFGKKAQSITSQ